MINIMKQVAIKTAFFKLNILFINKTYSDK